MPACSRVRDCTRPYLPATCSITGSRNAMLTRFVQFLVLAAAPLLVVPQTASSQVFVSGGAAWPLSPESTTNIYRSGYSFAGGVILEFGAFPFGRVRPFGSFQRFRTDPEPFFEQFENFDEVEGGEMPVLFAGVDLQLMHPFARFRPYVAPAIGLAVFSLEDITADGITFNLHDETTGVGVGLGGGFVYEVTRNYQLFAEAQYVYVVLESNDRSFVPVRVGIELAFDY